MLSLPAMGAIAYADTTRDPSASDAAIARIVDTCDRLTRTTGIEYYYGQGRLASIERVMPGPDGSTRYSVRLNAHTLRPRPRDIDIRISDTGTATLSTALEVDRIYAFCYTKDSSSTAVHIQPDSLAAIAPLTTNAGDPLFPSGAAEKAQRCNSLSTADRLYYYGEATFMSVDELHPPAGTPIRRESPNLFGASFWSPTHGAVMIRIPGTWKDPSAPIHKLELEPLPIAMHAGRRYGFCYQQRSLPLSARVHTFIDYPSSIQHVKE